MKRVIHKVGHDERVYFVGDLHGEITALNNKLADIGFDKDKDHLFSVGDLIDRGEDSLKCLELTVEPWFNCVRGNHEQMALDALSKGGDSVGHWLMNGGQWYFNLDCDDKARADDLINNHIPEMPHVMEIHHKGEVIVVCHADWPTIDYSSDVEVDEEYLIWSRLRIDNIKHGGENKEIKGADMFIFGHTPLKRPLQVDNQIWLDTGACFGKELTITEL